VPPQGGWGGNLRKDIAMFYTDTMICCGDLWFLHERPTMVGKFLGTKPKAYFLHRGEVPLTLNGFAGVITAGVFLPMEIGRKYVFGSQAVQLYVIPSREGFDISADLAEGVSV